MNYYRKINKRSNNRMSLYDHSIVDFSHKLFPTYKAAGKGQKYYHNLSLNTNSKS